jgi:hypothetical protein
MRHFRPPIHSAIVAVTVVAGLASYQGVDKLVLARGGSQYGTASEPGHGPSSTTSTTPHTSTTEDHGSTSTTVHHEPSPTSSTTPHTSTTEHHEPGPYTSTTLHTSTTVYTSTTVRHEPTPTTTAPTPPTSPPSVAQLSFGCMSGFTGGQGASKCAWSQSNAPNFGHYRLTRELVGTPRQTVFETSERGTTYYYDIGLQAGAQYSYIIEAYDTAGNLIARGGPVHLTCCGGTSTT